MNVIDTEIGRATDQFMEFALKIGASGSEASARGFSKW